MPTEPAPPTPDQITVLRARLLRYDRALAHLNAFPLHIARRADERPFVEAANEEAAARADLQEHAAEDLRALLAALEAAEASRDFLRRDRDGVQADLDHLRDGIGRRNLNRCVEDLICPRCGAQEVVHETDEEHPGVFECRGCRSPILA